MTSKTQADQSRRKFIGTSAAAVAGLTIAPGVLLHTPAQARPVDQAATSKQRWGILIDTNQCGNGCNDCVTACKTENAWGKNEVKSRADQQAQWIRKVNLKDPNTGHQQSLPVMCQHCETPPCVDVCPTGASMKRADGIVLVDKHICIGCRYCMMACPYKARSFVHEELHGQVSNAPRGKGTVESCTMCVDRVDAGGTPACVEACSKAMVFGDLMDPNSEISKRLKQYGGKQIRADLGLNPGVRYQGL
jgi:tetrathionate reductase subunit B